MSPVQIIHPWHLRNNIGIKNYVEKLDESIDSFYKELELKKARGLGGNYLVGFKGEPKNEMVFYVCSKEYSLERVIKKHETIIMGEIK